MKHIFVSWNYKALSNGMGWDGMNESIVYWGYKSHQNPLTFHFYKKKNYNLSTQNRLHPIRRILVSNKSNSTSRCSFHNGWHDPFVKPSPSLCPHDPWKRIVHVPIRLYLNTRPVSRMPLQSFNLYIIIIIIVISFQPPNNSILSYSTNFFFLILPETASSQHQVDDKQPWHMTLQQARREKAESLTGTLRHVLDPIARVCSMPNQTISYTVIT